MKKMIGILAIIITIWLRMISGLGNAAEPPIIWILIPSTTTQVEAFIQADDKVVAGFVRQEAAVTSIRFFRYDIVESGLTTDTVMLTLIVDGNPFTQPIELDTNQYNTIYTYDLHTQQLTLGTSTMRAWGLAAIRLGVTLAVEALVFLLFGYRHLRTWIAFLLINLLTQGTLNIAIIGFGPGGALFSFVFLEMLIFIFELFAFGFSVKEGNKVKLLAIVLLANAVSLIIGMNLLTRYPF